MSILSTAREHPILSSIAGGAVLAGGVMGGVMLAPGITASLGIGAGVKFLPKILGFTKTGLGKSVMFGASTVPISYGIDNLTSSIGLNKSENTEGRIAENNSKVNLLGAYGNASPEAINAVNDGNSFGIKKFILIGGLIIIAGMGVYFIGSQYGKK